MILCDEVLYNSIVNSVCSISPLFQIIIVSIFFYNVVTRYNFDDPQLTEWFESQKRIQSVLGAGLPQDFIPSLRHLPRLPKENKVKTLQDKVLQFVYDEFKDHRESFDPGMFICFFMKWTQRPDF